MIRNILILMCLYIMQLLVGPGLMAQERQHAGPAKTTVIYEANHKIFPRKWRNEEINPEFSMIAKEEIPRMQKVLNKALGKYPARVLKKNLRHIYVLRTLFFFGLEYGGTYYKRNIYIANKGINNGYTNEYLEGTLHHEFSSILWPRYSRFPDMIEWTEANPAGFTYGSGGVEALRTDETNLRLDSTLFEKGFLNEYSLASFEEDFNCFVEYIFRNDPGFWGAWQSSEAIRRKTEILIGLYHRIDPIFSLEYFKGL